MARTVVRWAGGSGRWRRVAAGHAAESPRVALLRRELVAAIGADLDPQGHSLGDLIHRYLKHARRHIPPGRRRVTFVRRFWDGPVVARHLNQVFAMARLVEEGADLTPYLSGRAHRPGRHPRDLQHDGDFALAAYDVHHLHFDPVDPNRPRVVRQKDKEDVLLFATFGREDAAFLMVGTHKSFHDGTLEDAVVHARADAGHMVLKGMQVEPYLTAQQRTRMGLRGVNAAAGVRGQAVMSSMVMSNGSSMRTLRMADFAADRVEEVDPLLNDVERARERLGPRVPDNPSFCWEFRGVRLILVETTTRIGFDFGALGG